MSGQLVREMQNERVAAVAAGKMRLVVVADRLDESRRHRPRSGQASADLGVTRMEQREKIVDFAKEATRGSISTSP